nr:hypothetical protein [uncultured Dyadobacter sp.]
MLFALFRDRIKLDISIDAVVEMINQELGKQGVVNAADIKYCRHYFGKRQGENDRPNVIADRVPRNNSNLPTVRQEVLTGSPDLKKLDWTDLTDISVAIEGIKSKFTKR